MDNHTSTTWNSRWYWILDDIDSAFHCPNNEVNIFVTRILFKFANILNENQNFHNILPKQNGRNFTTDKQNSLKKSQMGCNFGGNHDSDKRYKNTNWTQP